MYDRKSFAFQPPRDYENCFSRMCRVCMCLIFGFLVPITGFYILASFGEIDKVTLPFDVDLRACGYGELQDFPFIYFLDPLLTNNFNVCLKECPLNVKATSKLKCAPNSDFNDCQNEKYFYDSIEIFGKICMPTDLKYFQKISPSLKIRFGEIFVSTIHQDAFELVKYGILMFFFSLISLKIIVQFVNEFVFFYLAIVISLGIGVIFIVQSAKENPNNFWENDGWSKKNLENYDDYIFHITNSVNENQAWNIVFSVFFSAIFPIFLIYLKIELSEYQNWKPKIGFEHFSLSLVMKLLVFFIFRLSCLCFYVYILFNYYSWPEIDYEQQKLRTPFNRYYTFKVVICLSIFSFIIFKEQERFYNIIISFVGSVNTLEQIHNQINRKKCRTLSILNYLRDFIRIYYSDNKIEYLFRLSYYVKIDDRYQDGRYLETIDLQDIYILLTFAQIIVSSVIPITLFILRELDDNDPLYPNNFYLVFQLFFSYLITGIPFTLFQSIYLTKSIFLLDSENINSLKNKVIEEVAQPLSPAYTVEVPVIPPKKEFEPPQSQHVVFGTKPPSPKHFFDNKKENTNKERNQSQNQNEKNQVLKNEVVQQVFVQTFRPINKVEVPVNIPLKKQESPQTHTRSKTNPSSPQHFINNKTENMNKEKKNLERNQCLNENENNFLLKNEVVQKVVLPQLRLANKVGVPVNISIKKQERPQTHMRPETKPSSPRQFFDKNERKTEERNQDHNQNKKKFVLLNNLFEEVAQPQRYVNIPSNKRQPPQTRFKSETKQPLPRHCFAPKTENRNKVREILERNSNQYENNFVQSKQILGKRISEGMSLSNKNGYSATKDKKFISISKYCQKMGFSNEETSLIESESQRIKDLNDSKSESLDDVLFQLEILALTEKQYSKHEIKSLKSTTKKRKKELVEISISNKDNLISIALLGLYLVFTQKGFKVHIGRTSSPSSIPQSNSTSNRFQNIQKTNHDINITFSKQLILSGQTENISYFSLLAIPIYLDDQPPMSIRELAKKLKEDLSSFYKIPVKQIIILKFEVNSSNNLAGAMFRLPEKTAKDAQKKKINRNSFQYFKNPVILFSSLIDHFELSEDLFDTEFNMEWPERIFSNKIHYRGALPVNNRDFIEETPQPYNVPIGWFGLGINLKGISDKQQWLSTKSTIDTWIVLYHATKGQYIQQIFKSEDDDTQIQKKRRLPKLKPGPANAYGGTICRISGQIIKDGAYANVYLADNIPDCLCYADQNGYLIGNKRYQFIFQCRVNPYHVRSPKRQPTYYTVEKIFAKDSIRPYRLLIKEFGK